VKRLLLIAMFVPSALLAQRGPYDRPGRFDEDSAGPGPRRGYSLGIVGYTGGEWQPSGLEFAMLWRLGRRAQTAVGPWVALGSFTQAQSIYFGRSRGFFASLGLTVRQPIVTLLEMGSERTPSFVRFETTLDAGWSKNIDNPLPQGAWDFRTALLFGFSLGSRSALGQSFSILYGPSALIGRTTTTTHGEFVLRVRLPGR
jgi:hypothetical protein